MMMLISSEKISQPPDISPAIENKTLDDTGNSNETNTLSSVYVKVSNRFHFVELFSLSSQLTRSGYYEHEEDFTR